jgi:hypothetical protein
VNGLNLIPSDAIYIIQTDEPVGNWNKLGDSKIWKFLKTHPVFADITGYANYLDTLFFENKRVFNLVGKRDLYISAHPTRKGNYDFLFAIDLEKGARIGGLKTILQTTFEGSGYRVTTRSHNNHDILELYDPKARDILYLTIIDNFLVCSYTSILVEHSIEQYELPVLARDTRFTELITLNDDKGLGKLYVQYAFIDEYLSCYMGKPDAQVNNLSRILLYSAAWFNINDTEVEASGYTNLNDSMESYLQAILRSGKGKSEAASVLSSRTAVYLSFGFDGIEKFHSNLRQVLSGNPEKEAEFLAGIKKLEKLLKINVEDHLLSWIGSEAAFVQNKPSKYNSREDDIIIAIHASDIDKARDNLTFVAKQVKKRTPAKFKSMVFKNHDIQYLEIKGFFKLFFGNLFERLQKPYYTILGDYVLFSNNPKTLVGLILDYEEGRTLSEESGYIDFRNHFDPEQSIFCYLSGPRIHPLLNKFSSAETWSHLQKSRRYITSFGHSGFQLTSRGERFQTQMLLTFQDSVAKADTMEAVIDSVFRAEATELDSMLSSLDEVEKFILERIESNTYKKYFEGTDILQIEAETDKGVLDGNYKEYHLNGQPKVEGRFKKGKKKGIWKYYNEQGELTEKIRYQAL